MDEKIDVWKLSLTAGIFSLLFNAARATLIPFLTLYFRYLGLSSLQTGIVFALRAFVNILITFLWNSCGAQVEKKHKVLIMSLLATIISNTAFMFIPPRDATLFNAYCKPLSNFSSANNSFEFNFTLYTTQVLLQKSQFSSPITTIAYDDLPRYGITSGSIETSLKYDDFVMRNITHSDDELGFSEQLFSVRNDTVIEMSNDTVQINKTELDLYYETYTINNDTESGINGDSLQATTQNSLHGISTVARDSLVNMLFNVLPKGRQYFLQLGYTKEMLLDLPENEFENILRKIMLMNDDEGSGTTSAGSFYDVTNTFIPNAYAETTKNFSEQQERYKRDILASAFDGLHGSLGNLRGYVIKGGLETFVFILLVALASELFIAVLDAHSERMWYDFLSQLDMLQKYGQVRMWAALGSLITPILVTVVASLVRCEIHNGVSHFTVYFLGFLLFSVTALPFAFFYPAPVDSMFRERRRRENGTDCRSICCETSAWSLICSLFLIGFVSACPTVFLFWIIQESYGTEIIMGASITSAAISELLFLLALKWLVLRVSVVTTVTLCLLSLITRLVLYSFMWSVWVAVIGELLLPISTCLLWSSLRIHRSFNVNPYITDRGTENILRFFHQGLGFTLGSIVSGLLYNVIGSSFLFQGAAFILCLWCLPFWLLTRCRPQAQNTSYRKLMPWQQIEQEIEDSEEGDWLRDALDEAHDISSR